MQRLWIIPVFVLICCTALSAQNDMKAKSPIAVLEFDKYTGRF